MAISLLVFLVTRMAQLSCTRAYLIDECIDMVKRFLANIHKILLIIK